MRIRFCRSVVGVVLIALPTLAMMAGTVRAADAIQLPADDARHPGTANMPEWWYYNGHLTAKDGSAYAYELVFFQFQELGVPVRAVQFAVTDLAAKTFDHHTWIFPGQYADAKTGFELSIPGGPALRGSDGIDHFEAKLPDGTALTLDLKPMKKPILEVGTGLISATDPATGAAIADELYYSRSRQESSGTFTKNGITQKIGGLSWFDHEWGKLTRAGWVWYSIQLENGQEIMAYDMFNDPYGTPTFFGAEVIGTCFDCGNLVVIGEKQFSMPFSGAWKSPHSGITYPTHFGFEIPTADTKLELTPLIEDAEISAPKMPTYWEGPVAVTGIQYGHPVKGQGFIEMTGF